MPFSALFWAHFFRFDRPSKKNPKKVLRFVSVPALYYGVNSPIRVIKKANTDMEITESIEK